MMNSKSEERLLSVYTREAGALRHGSIVIRAPHRPSPALIPDTFPDYGEELFQQRAVVAFPVENTVGDGVGIFQEDVGEGAVGGSDLRKYGAAVTLSLIHLSSGWPDF